MSVPPDGLGLKAMMYSTRVPDLETNQLSFQFPAGDVAASVTRVSTTMGEALPPKARSAIAIVL
ncbi:MAG: hypothetical protein JWM16_2400 [Verrucomicrobiales bacterium]|nr:hypothetical protein [Verrucomicrobiales bacterium]